jgi:hypothetical protein
MSRASQAAARLSGTLNQAGDDHAFFHDFVEVKHDGPLSMDQSGSGVEWSVPRRRRSQGNRLPVC